MAIENIEQFINRRNLPTYPFQCHEEEQTNFTDDEMEAIIERGIAHSHRGDVFQVVLSRRFSRAFKGDDFNVYRALRSINPSPYLFFFDFGSFKIFGSSPESQVVVEGKKASVCPIAGTTWRTGNEETDRQLIEVLQGDPKENAEHVMLVDLARNDLSKHCENVGVETYKEVQLYSHVIHLVSKVTGTLAEDRSAIRVLTDTYPAGTLSGAPKHRAMQIIDQLERGRRHHYGGAIGLIDFKGNCNHAIVIRSFLSKNNTLYYQGGAGIVADSVPQREVEEVHKKLEALRQAVHLAGEL